MARRAEAVGADVTTSTVDAEILGVRHSARLLPEFDCGSVGIGQKRGRIVVERFCGRMYSTHHPAEVIGWRLVCQCEQLTDGKPPVTPWTDRRLWTRVDDESEHATGEFRVYAPDELTIDVMEIPDVSAAAHSVWMRTHIKCWTALSRIHDTLQDLRAAQGDYRDAVQVAKGTELADPDVLATMALRPSEIEFLRELLGGGADG